MYRLKDFLEKTTASSSSSVGCLSMHAGGQHADTKVLRTWPGDTKSSRNQRLHHPGGAPGQGMVRGGADACYCAAFAWDVGAPRLKMWKIYEDFVPNLILNLEMQSLVESLVLLLCYAFLFSLQARWRHVQPCVWSPGEICSWKFQQLSGWAIWVHCACHGKQLLPTSRCRLRYMAH